jgi:hypothetical protein
MFDRRKSVTHVIWSADLIGSRISLAIGEFFWAIMLLWYGDTFSRPTYAHMAVVMVEEWWGLMFLLSSMTQFYIVLSNKMHSTWAWYFAGWNFCLWGFTVWSMLASVYPPPAAIGGEMALALAAFWIWLRPLIISESNK